MPVLGTQLNEGAVTLTETSAYDGDDGSGNSTLHHFMAINDGADRATGATDDAAETDPSQSGSVVAFLKGILTTLNSILTRTQPGVTAATTALASSLIAKSSAGNLRGFVGYTTTDQFVQVHNTSSVPANGVAPLVCFPVQANVPFSIDFGYAIPCDTGIVICNSTTGLTKTLGAADMFVTVVYD